MDFLIPVLGAEQMRECDAFTIKNEPIQSRDLMERASRALYNSLKPRLKREQKIVIICGPGNNGGDGLCLSRMLLHDGFDAHVFRCLFGKKASDDNQVNFELLSSFAAGRMEEIKKPDALDISQFDVIIDALFGAGLTSGLTKYFAGVVQKINKSGKRIFSLDMPSGLKDSGDQGKDIFVMATLTISIQVPKPAFFYAENKILFECVNAEIDLSGAKTESYFLSEEGNSREKILSALPPKTAFGHKGDFGHVLLVGGNTGMHGAIALAAGSCIEHGAGMTSIFAPAGARLYTGNIPSAMHSPHKLVAENLRFIDWGKYTVLCAGPGLDRDKESAVFLNELLKKWDKPVILDADALNILASDKTLWKKIKPGSILSPHPGEFRRLFGEYKTTEEKWSLAKKNAREKQVFILAKDKYSVLFCPNGKTYINGSGGPELAQGGSGDILSGAIAAWLARTDDPEIACIAAMYLCGTGDFVD